MDKNCLWSLVAGEQLLSDEQVDKLSMEEIKELDNLYSCYFAQMGHSVNLKFPFAENYLKINQKINKLNQ